jgi:hypothetical protein
MHLMFPREKLDTRLASCGFLDDCRLRSGRDEVCVVQAAENGAGGRARIIVGSGGGGSSLEPLG